MPLLKIRYVLLDMFYYSLQQKSFLPQIAWRFVVQSTIPVFHHSLTFWTTSTITGPFEQIGRLRNSTVNRLKATCKKNLAPLENEKSLQPLSRIRHETQLRFVRDEYTAWTGKIAFLKCKLRSATTFRRYRCFGARFRYLVIWSCGEHKGVLENCFNWPRLFLNWSPMGWEGPPDSDWIHYCRFLLCRSRIGGGGRWKHSRRIGTKGKRPQTQPGYWKSWSCDFIFVPFLINRGEDCW